MSGVSIVKALLHANTALTAVVPTSRIMAGDLPLGTVTDAKPNAISIKTISATTRKTVAMNETKKLITERVQVTALTKSFPTKKAVLDLVRSALPLSRGTVASYEVDSILPDIEGPDLDDLGVELFERAQDFIVKFSR